MTLARHLFVLIPGDLETRTGGYEYDRRIIAGLRERGWAVSVVHLEGAYPLPTPDERAAAARALSAIPDDALVLADGLAFGALPDQAVREQSRLRLLALVHHPLAAETGLGPDVVTLLDVNERRALGAARGAVVTSYRTVDAVRALGVEPARIAVVEPGTEPAPLSPGSGGPDLQLLCVASVTPRKGHAVLVQALATLRGLPWRLTCVGSLERDRDCADAVQQQIVDAGLADRVSFTGELEGEALEAAYQGADLFVLPTFYEGFGMVVAEALAHGIPVVSTDTGGIVELVGDIAGVLVPAGNVDSLAGELKRLITDRGDYAKIRRGAEKRRGRLATWDTASARMEEAVLRLGAR